MNNYYEIFYVNISAFSSVMIF